MIGGVAPSGEGVGTDVGPEALVARARATCLATPEPALGESLEALEGLVDSLGARRVLLVVDQGAMDATGAGPLIERVLGGRVVGRFGAFTPNPKSHEVAIAARAAIDLGVDALVAFGGGSCLDVAKVGALGAAHAGQVDSITRDEGRPSRGALPVVAVPTTSGTGSEATHFAAVYVDGRKVSIAHPSMRPWGVVLDARLHSAMPAPLAAVTGLDALAQAMESLWSVGATESSMEHARVGGALVAAGLESSVRDGSIESRRLVMWGAHLAGRAIDASKTTAAHALSYAITTAFGVPHGLAVALTLGHVGAANEMVTESDCLDPRGPGSVRRRVREAAGLLGVSAQELPDRVGRLLRSLGLAGSLGAAGVPRDRLVDLARSVDPVRLGNNPRRLDQVVIERLLADAY